MKQYSRMGLLGLVLATSSPIAAQSLATRQGQDVAIADPAVRIGVPRAAHHAGSDRWLLFEVADCQIELFVEADRHKRVRRYYWVQAEAYLPSRPELHYDQPKQPVLRLGERDFHVVARIGRSDDAPRAGSDLEHVLRLLAARGYTLPTELGTVRLLHRPGPAPRREAMIIYGEDLALNRATIADLAGPDGYRPGWAAVERALIDHATRRIRIGD